MKLLTCFGCIIVHYLACARCQSPQTNESQPVDSNGLVEEENDTNPSESLQHIDAIPNYKSKEFIKFDLSLLNVLSEQNRDKNIVISPSSIKSLLALLTRVYSKDKVDGILQVSGDQSGCISLLQNIQFLLENNQSSITIESRNKIYQASGLHEIDETTIGSTEIETLNFTSPFASDVINKWVNDSTHGLISSVVEKAELSEQTKLFLLNCIYLKAKWDVAFDPSNTRSNCFYHSPGLCQQVKFMYIKRQLNYAYFEDHKSMMFEIPFKDPRYTIVFVLPDKNMNVYDVLTSLRNKDLFKFFRWLRLESVKLFLPRTNIEFADDGLINTLKKPSVKSFFGRNDKLDSMLQYDTLLSVDTLFHRAKIELNEEGAEAAAVSGGFEFRSAWDDDLLIRVDRPFLFFLRDTITGFILFEGMVFSPDPSPQ